MATPPAASSLIFEAQEALLDGDQGKARDRLQKLEALLAKEPAGSAGPANDQGSTE
jgi:hypothetical protein